MSSLYACRPSVRGLPSSLSALSSPVLSPRGPIKCRIARPISSSVRAEGPCDLIQGARREPISQLGATRGGNTIPARPHSAAAVPGSRRPPEPRQSSPPRAALRDRHSRCDSGVRKIPAYCRRSSILPRELRAVIKRPLMLSWEICIPSRRR